VAAVDAPAPALAPLVVALLPPPPPPHAASVAAAASATPTALERRIVQMRMSMSVPSEV
jgi:hypothetical protein